MKRKNISIAIITISFFSCFFIKKNSFNKAEFLFPEIVNPKHNRPTKERVELGQKLFFDPILSIDSSLSCASCHKPNLAFSDDVAFSPGVYNRAGVRNAPSLANIGYHPYFLREGSIKTIEMQVLVPIQEENEFAHNIVDIAEQMKKNPEYVKMSKEAYGKSPDPYVITRALAAYERTLVSKNSKFDKFINGEIPLTKEEKQGFDLFMSNKTNCSSCHGGFNFTQYKITNNGLYENYKDEGRMRATKNNKDLALFKTPSLRNIELTAPYMHDGSLTTLEEVVEHYNTGGKNHIHKDSLIVPLNLNKNQKLDLVSFLKTLTDFSFVQDN
ncbi:MAG: cytochrome c peroxidase [Flavobacteriales bacterium]|jgi:cytochrome c peroxidase